MIDKLLKKQLNTLAITLLITFSLVIGTEWLIHVIYHDLYFTPTNVENHP